MKLKIFLISSIVNAFASPVFAQLKGLKYKFLMDSLNSGVVTIKDHEDYVYRGASIPESELATYCEGCEIHMKSFVSTSTNTGFPGGQKFVIKSKTGIYIAPLSTISREAEVRT